MSNGPRSALPRLLPWLVTAVCFTYLYFRLDAAAERNGFENVGNYLASRAGEVSWGAWLAVMVPYSCFYFLIDSVVTWRVINWFNARVRLRDILPIRGSAYILSILNEQVSKGAIAMYLNRRDGIPGWQVASSMLFIMFCEFYYLLGWATLGVGLEWARFSEISIISLPWGAHVPLFHTLPVIALAAVAFFFVFVTYFQGRIRPHSPLRERQIFHAFRRGRAWQYAALILLRSPALLAAVVVYTFALRLFGVEIDAAEMLAYLPVIFFGAATPGPMRSVAIVLWVILFPNHEAELAMFGLVQHNFFIFFNAVIGLAFLRRANRELFGGPRHSSPAGPR